MQNSHKRNCVNRSSNPLPKKQRADNPHAKEKLRELLDEPEKSNDSPGGNGEINTPFAGLEAPENA